MTASPANDADPPSVGPVPSPRAPLAAVLGRRRCGVASDSAVVPDRHDSKPGELVGRQTRSRDRLDELTAAVTATGRAGVSPRSLGNTTAERELGYLRRSETAALRLRIRRLGVRIPPSAHTEAQANLAIDLGFCASCGRPAGGTGDPESASTATQYCNGVISAFCLCAVPAHA